MAVLTKVDVIFLFAWSIILVMCLKYHQLESW